jgi:hypothetical protein
MKNLYHILHKTPVFTKEEIEIEYEELAIKLQASGLIRIDTGLCCNFINFLDPEIGNNITISKEQLNENLIQKTRNKLTNIYSRKFKGANLEKKVRKVIAYFKEQMSKNVLVNNDLMLKLIRVLIQATHPIVLRWVLIEEVEIFISYAYNIGDVMDVVTWRQAGQNSGMQSTDGQNAAVFVSCGGDPFRATDKNHPTYGDGWPALARIQIIAGQELGHYSDIKRNDKGQQISRHSANFSATMATDHVKKARKQDIQTSIAIHKQLIGCGLNELIKNEHSLKFYRKNNVSNLKVYFLRLKLHLQTRNFITKTQKLNLEFVMIFKNETYIASMLQAMIYDMQFNLTPQADVYTKADKDHDEAIKCVEALARVPQQVMKWGYVTTKRFMPGLYQVYYGQIIPSLIEVYQKVTGQKYQRNYSKPKLNLIYKIKKLFQKDKLKPVRELDD